jgi:hypothetical protein
MSDAAQKRAARQARDAWSFSLSSYADQEEWARLLYTVNPVDFMRPEERKKFDALPDKFKIYRGFQRGCRNGLSWTLSEDIAEKFSNFNLKLPKGKVRKRTVYKSDVYAALDNDEQEIIILPKDLRR